MVIISNDGSTVISNDSMIVVSILEIIENYFDTKIVYDEVISSPSVHNQTLQDNAVYTAPLASSNPIGHVITNTVVYDETLT